MPAAEQQPPPALDPALRSTGSFPWSPHLQRQKPGRGRAGLYRGLAPQCQPLALHRAALRAKFRASQHVAACGRSCSIRCLRSLTSLPGVGPKLEKLYARLLDREAPRVVDLLFHMPSGAIDRRARPKLNDVQPGQVVTVAVTVDEHRPSPPHRPRAPYRIYASDDTGDTHADLFQRAPRLSRKAPAGRRDALRLRHRRVLRRHAADGASRPRRGREAALPRCRWSSRSIRSPKASRSAMSAARWTARSTRLPDLPEWQDEAWVAREQFPAFSRRCGTCTGRPSRATSLPENACLDAACL